MPFRDRKNFDDIKQKFMTQSVEKNAEEASQESFLHAQTSNFSISLPNFNQYQNSQSRKPITRSRSESNISQAEALYEEQVLQNLVEESTPISPDSRGRNAPLPRLSIESQSDFIHVFPDLVIFREDSNDYTHEISSRVNTPHNSPALLPHQPSLDFSPIITRAQSPIGTRSQSR